MAQAMVLLLVFSLFWLPASEAFQDNIGINWGNIASHPLNPSIVVGMLKDNGVKKVKLFDSDSWTVSSLAGTGIEVMIAVPNNQLHRFADDDGAAKKWVKENVTKHLHDGGTDIRYVAVGNEPFLTSYKGSYTQTLFPALRNIQKALESAGIGDKVKATVPFNAAVYESSSDVPSEGDFRSDVRSLMLDIVKFLKEKNSPFVVNIYPFLSLYQNPGFPTDFAFFDGAGKPITDKGNTYTNVFDANLDTLAWTLKKHGFKDMQIIVGEIGWPTDGSKNADVKSAKTFYNGLLKKLASNKGSPMRPGPMDVYLFGLLDENMKSVDPGNFERHWGIFRYDGQPKFPINLDGKNTKLIGAKGVQYMENQWCVLDPDAKDLSGIGDAMGYACSRADCTPILDGGSYNGLHPTAKTSYAFNIFFQMNDQSVEACDFNGLGKITTQNVSTGGILYPIQIMSSAYKLNSVSLVSILASFIIWVLCFV